MTSMDRLNSYLGEIERRLRLAAWTRGVAALAVCAAAATFLLVLYANAFAFSAQSLTVARFGLFVILGVTAAVACVGPLVRLTRAAAARRAERRFPVFEERLLTLAEKAAKPVPGEDPFLELLAADALLVAERAPAIEVAPRRRIIGGAAAAAAGAAALLWMIFAGPGFLGHGAALLWGVTPHGGAKPYYDIQVQPGDATVRKGGDQWVTATVTGLEARQVRLCARFASATRWEETVMAHRESGSGYQFLFAALSEPVDYYVEAGGLRSRTYRLQVVDLPHIKRVRVAYRFPAWTGLKEAVQEGEGDLRAVEGTEARVMVEFDRPLGEGALELNGDRRLPLLHVQDRWYAATVAIREDGVYHIAAVEKGKSIRLSEDYFIEARKETPPALLVRRPGRDARVSPIEEVTVEVQAEDDFALEGMDLHYSVNGGPERVIPLLARKGVRQAAGSTLIALEDYKLAPGDIVSLYAVARDARSQTRSEIYFLEAQPYEREYSQSQVAGGMQGEGQEEEGGRNQISRRQKEIIAATWNQLRDRSGDRAAAAENGKFLSEVQGKLRDQARSLARRMASRQLSGENEEFSRFTKDMETAAQEMQAAVDKLKALNWKDALPAEQRALQHLLRAESVFRQIQVAMGSRNQGGGSSGGGRDLENMFDLELDLEKNQYEAGQQASAATQRQREIDEALQKLERLARRQQELAQQRRQPQQSFEQRWQQELLRREAEQLQRRLEELAQGSPSAASQASPSGQLSRSSQASSSSQPPVPQGRNPVSERLREMAGRGGESERLRQALEQLRRATEDMRRASAPDANSSDARKAAERLEQARDVVNGMRRQDAAGQLENLRSDAERLAARQREFAEQLKRAYAGQPENQPSISQQQLEQMSSDKQKLLEELQRLEKEMQAAARDLAASQRAAAAKLREALGEMQQNELATRMRLASEWVRRGYGPMIGSREDVVTRGLERLRDQLGAARRLLDQPPSGSEALEQTLSQVEQLRAQLERGQSTRSLTAGGTHGDYAEAIRQLAELRRRLDAHPEWRHDGIDGLRNLLSLDPNRVANITSQIVPALRELELALRRKLDEQQLGQVRSAGSDPVPQGYSKAVAEYFRRLSKP